MDMPKIGRSFLSRPSRFALSCNTRGDESKPRKLPYGLVGVPCIVLIVPNVLSPEKKVAFGRPKLGWLNALNACAPIAKQIYQAIQKRFSSTLAAATGGIR